jgi:hypothetical protein
MSEWLIFDEAAEFARLIAMAVAKRDGLIVPTIPRTVSAL